MATAKITNQNGIVSIQSPYNASLVADIKELPGRKWDAINKAWTVPASQEEAAREIVRGYFQIEGEESVIQYEEIEIIVRAKSSYKRSYIGNVTIDGHGVVNGLYGSVNYKSSAFEVLQEKGGFTRGDSRHAFEVEYHLWLKVRKGAAIETTGHADYWGWFQIVESAPDPEPTKKEEDAQSSSETSEEVAVDIQQQSFTAREAASFLGISLSQLGYRRRRGYVNAERVNSRIYRYSRADLLAYQSAQVLKLAA